MAFLLTVGRGCDIIVININRSLSEGYASDRSILERNWKHKALC